MSCVFCEPNWHRLDVVERCMPVGPVGSVAIINPLDPVTEGHVLVIHREHDVNAADSWEASRRFALLSAVAADYVRARGIEANIFTNIGPNATQTVFHTHVHIVPRHANDGLPVPWTPQHELKAAQGDRDEIMRVMQRWPHLQETER